MDFNDTPQEALFRQEARQWLAANAPAFEKSEGISEAQEVALGKAWQKRLSEGGYAGILLPRQYGGRGATIAEATVFGEEESKYHLAKEAYIGIGLGMALPVIFKHGTPEQIEKFAGPTLRGEMTWCQLFSEPSAGSDLAAVRTRAVRDGNDYVVNGQKVWSSWAHHSDWGILIVRTDPGLPKHKGLTFFVVDMKTPGIEVRPIRQISGASDFNETFLPFDVIVGDRIIDRLLPFVALLDVVGGFGRHVSLFPNIQMVQAASAASDLKRSRTCGSAGFIDGVRGTSSTIRNFTGT